MGQVIQKNSRGFTLIEMSIVLVIIGLVIGSVLVGQDLIHSAHVRAQTEQLVKYQTAFNTFRDKYGCVPGDCTNATQFFGSSVQNGNGNGLIDTSNGLDYGNNNTWQNCPEMWSALLELGLSGMIDFIATNTNNYNIPGQNVPATVLNPPTGFFIGANYNYTRNSRNSFPPEVGQNTLLFVVCNNGNHGGSGISSWDTSCGVFYASDLQAIDTKIDDGLPASGNLLGFDGPGVGGIYVCSTLQGAWPYYPNSTYINNAQSKKTQGCQAVFVIN